MMKGIRAGISGLALLAFVAGSQACSRPGWKGTISNEEGVLVVRNPGQPLYETPVLELEEDLSIGGLGAQGERNLVRRIVREYDPVAVTDAEKSEQEKVFQGSPFQGDGTAFRPSKVHAAYRWFFLSHLGHIFVATFETASDGRIIHDVFDPRGRFIGSIPLERMGVGIAKGKFYAREEDAEGYPVLKRYAVTWLVK